MTEPVETMSVGNKMYEVYLTACRKAGTEPVYTREDVTSMLRAASRGEPAPDAEEPGEDTADLLFGPLPEGFYSYAEPEGEHISVRQEVARNQCGELEIDFAQAETVIERCAREFGELPRLPDWDTPSCCAWIDPETGEAGGRISKGAPSRVSPAAARRKLRSTSRVLYPRPSHAKRRAALAERVEKSGKPYSMPPVLASVLARMFPTPKPVARPEPRPTRRRRREYFVGGYHIAPMSDDAAPRDIVWLHPGHAE